MRKTAIAVINPDTDKLISFTVIPFELDPYRIILDNWYTYIVFVDDDDILRAKARVMNLYFHDKQLAKRIGFDLKKRVNQGE